jgi:hypothetical protein
VSSRIAQIQAEAERLGRLHVNGMIGDRGEARPPITDDRQSGTRALVCSLDGHVVARIQRQAEAERCGISPADLAGEILTAIVPGWIAASIYRQTRLSGGTRR